MQHNCFLFSLSEPKSCLEDATLTIYGQYFWPETFPQVIAEMVCNTPASHRAYRLW